MELKIDIQQVIDSLSEKITSDLTKKNLLVSSTSSIDVRKEEDKSFSPTALSKETGYSKSSIYSMLRTGLPYYQFGSKKMIHIQEFKNFITQYRIEIPHKEKSYEECETQIRKGKKLGDKLWREFKTSGNKLTLSQFSLWIFENNHTNALNNFLIINLNNNDNE